MIQTTVAVAMIAKVLIDAMIALAGAALGVGVLAGAVATILFFAARRVWRAAAARAPRD